MRKHTLHHAARCLTLTVLLTVCTAAPAPAGEIPIGPEPCAPSGQAQCTATGSTNNSAAPPAGEAGAEAGQDLTVGALLALTPYIGTVLALVNS